MTQKEALQILIQHAARSVTGTGTGIRPAITDDDRADVAKAVAKVWERAYGYEYSSNEAYNLGLRWHPGAKREKMKSERI